jgi:hypothetical protein
MLGAGQIGVAVPTNDALGYYFNPAILGYWARENNVSLFFMPEKADWAKMGKYKFNNYGINLGYSSEGYKRSSSFSLGFGYLHNSFDFGSGNEDLFNGYSLGISFGGGLIFNIGGSIKSFSSKLKSDVSGKTYEATGTAYDAGALIIFPFSKLFLDDADIYLEGNTFIRPVLSLAVGYSITNIGDEIHYINESQSDPIPRTARLGYSINAGFDVHFNRTKLSAFNYTFAAEAQDLLIKSKGYDGFEYQSIMGDIDFKKNLVELRGDSNIMIHRGHIFRIFETVVITSGRMNSEGYDQKSDGWGISSEGIFKTMSMAADNSVFDFISKHIIIEYFNANIYVGTFSETNLKGLALHLRNIEL